MWKSELGARDHIEAFSEIRQYWKSHHSQVQHANHTFLGNHVDILEHIDFEIDIDFADIPELIDFKIDFEYKRT